MSVTHSPITTRNRRSAVIIAALTVAALAACSDSTRANVRTTIGPDVALGNGTAHTWVTVDPSGTPIALGLAFTEDALTGLPTSMSGVRLQFPREGQLTPFEHVEIDWNPMGHAPQPYMVPHFDFHFYQITEAEQDAITPSDSNYDAKMAAAPSAEFIPQGYIQTPGGVPQMGAHWVDPTSPELNGQPFTSTFIYGSWNGAFTFMEPMMALSYLQSKPDTTMSVKLPAQYAAPGRYPTTYGVSYDASAKEYRITLGTLVQHN
ncbi:MAG TPA: DUF5602 domain-containing protein [Gemmatimonadaceae bacterium]|jgi:hypothetical protein|nr:DUF5602 domain-containing protein [Gemmatimonadaceae bacterium]